MDGWREVEVAAAEELDGPTGEELAAIRKAAFTVAAVLEREKVLDHDTAAFVDVLAASAGPAGRWIHFGLTSSDVVDTGLALQLRAAGDIVLAGAREVADALAERAREHVDTVCVGRTHGVHAEPTTFGIKLAGFAMEARRNVRAPGARLRAGERRGDQRRGRDVRDARAGVRGARPRASRAWRPSRSPRRSSRATATPRSCRPSRSPARASSASRRRSATCSARRSARREEAVSGRRPERLERDAPQAQPDRLRAHLRPGPRPARLRVARRSRTSPCGTSATSRTPAPSG